MKKGPDNSALVSTSLLSSSPSLVAFGDLRPFSLENEDALGSVYTYYTYYNYYLSILMSTRVRTISHFHLKFRHCLLIASIPVMHFNIEDIQMKTSSKFDSPIQYFIVMANTGLSIQSINPSFI